MLNRILRSAIIAVATSLGVIQPAVAQIIPRPNMSPTPTIPPIVGPLPTSTPGPTTPALGPTVMGLLKQANPQSARALVRYGQNNVLALANDQGRFQKVALQPDEVVTVVMTLTPKDYGKAADVQVLDGGAMSTDLVDIPAPNKLPPTPTPFPTGSPPMGPSSGPSSESSATPLPTVAPTPPDIEQDGDPLVPDMIDTGALMTVSQAGELLFRFRPGKDIGLHRVSVVVGGNQYFFQFWRQDMNAQNTNPRMLRAY